VLQIGWAAMRAAAAELLPQVDDLTWSACHRAAGDTGETLQYLMEAYPPKAQSAQRTLFDVASEPFVVAEAADLLARIAAAPAAGKPKLLEAAWRRMTPVEAKYFTKIITGGMRIGLSESLVEDAVAKAFGRELEAVRHSNMLSGDIGETAVLAKADRLQETPFRLFHPLGFMLASPVEEPPEDVGEYLVEDKFDGIRAQLHVANGRAELFSRTLAEDHCRGDPAHRKDHDQAEHQRAFGRQPLRERQRRRGDERNGQNAQRAVHQHRRGGLREVHVVARQLVRAIQVRRDARDEVADERTHEERAQDPAQRGTRSGRQRHEEIDPPECHEGAVDEHEAHRGEQPPQIRMSSRGEDC